MRTLAEKAQKASRKLALLSTESKNQLLMQMAEALSEQRKLIQEENEKDLDFARQSGLSASMLDRLELSDKRVDAMIQGVKDLVKLEDPVGKILEQKKLVSGIELIKKKVPIGVIAIIYESRPNVTADAAALCFKAGNAVILRGGKEAIHSNIAIAKALNSVADLADNAIQLVQTTERSAVKELVQLEGLVDLVIPRGGEGLIRAVVQDAKIPVIKHYKGICHTYVDRSADLEMAVNISENAKCQRPGVCNAMETLLIDRRIAKEFLPKVSEVFLAQGVELRGDKESCEIIAEMKQATEEDWSTEYLEKILSVKLVDDLQAAIEHINHYGSHHSDAIIADDKQVQEAFLAEVDSSSVYVNASTRFTDGAEFGLGAEIGISTDKLHARGPMGLEELCTYKFILYGKGEIRE